MMIKGYEKLNNNANTIKSAKQLIRDLGILNWNFKLELSNPLSLKYSHPQTTSHLRVNWK